MGVKKVLDDNGFTYKWCCNCWEVSQYTPAGEDWIISLSKLNDIKTYAEDYDPQDDFNYLWEAKCYGLKGVPDVPELWKDQLWKQEKLNKVLEDLE